MFLSIYLYHGKMARRIGRRPVLEFYDELRRRLVEVWPDCEFVEHGDLWRLSLPPQHSREDVLALLSSLFALKEFVEDRSHLHHGIAFLLEDGGSGGGRTHEEIPLGDGCLWSTEGVYRLLVRHVRAKREEDLWLLTELRGYTPSSVEFPFSRMPLSRGQCRALGRCLHILRRGGVCHLRAHPADLLDWTLVWRLEGRGWTVLPQSFPSGRMLAAESLLSGLLRLLISRVEEDDFPKGYVGEMLRRVRYEDILVDIPLRALYHACTHLMDLLRRRGRKVLVLIASEGGEEEEPILVRLLEWSRERGIGWVWVSSTSPPAWLKDRAVSVVAPGLTPRDRERFFQERGVDPLRGAGTWHRFELYARNLVREDEGPGPLESFLMGLSPKERRLLLLHELCFPVLGEERIKDWASRWDITPLEVEEMRTWLQEYGLLYPGAPSSPRYSGLSSSVGEVREMVAHLSTELRRLGHSIPWFWFPHLQGGERDSFIWNLYRGWLRGDSMVRDAREGWPLSTRLREEERRGLLLLSRMMYALEEEERGEGDRVVTLYEKETSLSSPFREFLDLHVVRYLRGTDPPRALSLVKDLIFRLQNGRPSSFLRIVAYLELTLAIAARGTLRDAEEYLHLAVHLGEKDQATGLLASLVESTLWWLEGSYTRTLLSLTTALDGAVGIDLPEVRAALGFVLGRTHVEFGEYEKALEVFDATHGYFQTVLSSRALRVFKKWKARCLFFLDRPEEADRILQELPEDEEARLFRIEAAARAGDTERIMELLSLPPEDVKKYPEVKEDLLPWWYTGFGLIEERVFYQQPRERVPRMLTRVLELYARGMEGDMSAVEAFSEIIRHAHLRKGDPYTHLYHLWYGEILLDLERRGLSYQQDHPLTILGKGVKLLQVRASRIENATQKRHYLYRNYWNGRLMELARRHKLVY